MTVHDHHTTPDHLPFAHSSDGMDEFLQVLALKFERVCGKLERICDDLSGRVKPYYTVDEVAEMTGRSAYTVRRWITDGRISATRIAGTGPKGRLLIAREELSKLMNAGIGDGVPAAAVGVKGNEMLTAHDGAELRELADPEFLRTTNSEGK